ncbi:MAG: hypothetical protein ACI9AT_000279 [Ulvibacter sp.]|jgi:hypothetical protein
MSSFEALQAIGAEIKRDKNNQLIIGFTSQSISDEQLSLLTNLDANCLLAFYSCDFSNCNLSILKRSNHKKIAIIYSQFTDTHLRDICEIKSLRWLKLFDTKVSSEAVEAALIAQDDLEIILN